MEIENRFTVDAPVEEAWALLTNIPEIAPCLPGARLDGEAEGVFSGAVKVKVGPVTAEYKGTAEFVERDDTNHKAVISGKGRDSRGAGNAQALITATMTPSGDNTTVDIHTDLKITGKVAQFGRGVMQDVSEKLLGQFAECLAGKLGDDESIEEIAAASAAAAPDEVESTIVEKAAAAGEAVAGKVPDAVGDATEAVSEKAGQAADEVLDLLDVAGGAMAKRLIPVAVVAIAIIVIIILLIV